MRTDTAFAALFASLSLAGIATAEQQKAYRLRRNRAHRSLAEVNVVERLPGKKERDLVEIETMDWSFRQLARSGSNNSRKNNNKNKKNRNDEDSDDEAIESRVETVEDDEDKEDKEDNEEVIATPEAGDFSVDEFGCAPQLGFSWCPLLQTCIREPTPCPDVDAGPKPSSEVVAETEETTEYVVPDRPSFALPDKPGATADPLPAGSPSQPQESEQPQQPQDESFALPGAAADPVTPGRNSQPEPTQQPQPQVPIDDSGFVLPGTETRAPTKAPTTNAPTRSPTTNSPTKAPTEPGSEAATGSFLFNGKPGLPGRTPITAQDCPLGAQLRADAILTELTFVTDLSNLDDDLTPQGKAYDWLTLYDDGKVCPGLMAADKIRQRYILATLYFATSGGQWNACYASDQFCSFSEFAGDVMASSFKTVEPKAWLSGHDECEWAGVECNSDGYVRFLELAANGLVGIIPEEIVRLRNLDVLDLEDNRLVGAIPQTPFAEGLFRVKLYNNDLTGPLPVFPTSLLTLDVSNNRLDGTLDTALANLPKLKKLSLNGNKFDGTIPRSLGIVSSDLKEARFQDNKLTGEMPGEICQSRVMDPIGFKRLAVDCDEVQCQCCTPECL